MNEKLPSRFDPLLFGGNTFEPDLDERRLVSLLARVQQLMSDGRWRTLQQIRSAVGGSEASISARLRDLRKSRWGAFVVERRRRGDPKRGIFEYSVRRGE